MSPASPATAALLDQLHAATRDGATTMAGLAGGLGAALTTEPATGPIAALARRLADRAATGRLGRCDHLAAAPGLAVWLAYAPGRLRCRPCTERTARRIRGTRADHTCDHCRRRPRGGVHPGAVLLPGVVLNDAARPLAAGPWLVLFGLCPRCCAASRTAEPR